MRYLIQHRQRKTKEDNKRKDNKQGVRFLLPVLFISTSIVLGGCISPSNDISATKADIEDYNKVVTDTMESYNEMVSFIDKQQEDLRTFLIKGDQGNLLSKEILDTLEPLTEEEQEIFRNPSIYSNDYFTGLGSKGVRQVLVYTGVRATMYTTIVWLDEEIISITRKVTTQ